jgi:hypothetical protein
MDSEGLPSVPAEAGKYKSSWPIDTAPKRRNSAALCSAAVSKLTDSS